MKNKITIFKGFSNKFMEEVYKVTPKLMEETDLTKLFTNSKKIGKEFLLTKDEGEFAGIYEQLLGIESAVDMYEGEIEIIENNISKSYLCDMKNLEVEAKNFVLSIEKEEIEDELENPILENFFGEIKTRDEKFYVKFRDIDSKLNKKIKKSLYYSKDDTPLAVIEEKEIPRGAISFSEGEIELLDILDKIEKYEVVKKIDVAISNKKELKNLAPLNEFCKNSQIELNIFLEEEKKEYIPRPELKDILSSYWKSQEFRELNFYREPDTSNEIEKKSQGELIEEIIVQAEKASRNESYRDMFITAPTGSGKSVLFQIPAIYLYNHKEEKPLTIIVSPLKALMKDQVDSLGRRGVKNSSYLNSDQSYQEREEIIGKIKDGTTALLYLSPELLLASNIDRLIGDRKIGALIIDEAHTVSTWGKNFRVDYWMLGHHLNKIKNFREEKFPIIATTATAIYGGDNDTVSDISDSLKLNTGKPYIGQVTKSNIKFDVRKIDKVKKNDYNSVKDELLFKLIDEKIEKKEKTIIYFPYARQIQEKYHALSEGNKNRVGCYFGEANFLEKQKCEKDFRTGEKFIMLATKAFGMGIDIDDIGSVYHYAPSGDLADYVQEIGRAGRKDGVTGVAEIDFNIQDMTFKRKLNHISGVKQWQASLAVEKLNELYKMNGGRRNMLVDVESFSFIFNGTKEKNLDQKVKLALIAIEKDFLDKSPYPVVLVRPKSIISKGYIKIPNDLSLEKSEIEKVGVLKEIGKEVYQIDLEKYWIKNFSDMNFPQFMAKYYKKEIFNERIKPQKYFEIKVEKDMEEIKRELSKNLDEIFNSLGEFEKTFTKEMFVKELNSKLKNQEKSEKIVNLILSTYTNRENQNGDVQNNFLTATRVVSMSDSKNMGELEEKYRCTPNKANKVKSDLKRLFHDFVQGKSEDGKFGQYVDLDYKGIEIASILETLDLGTYSVKGGDTPKLFIRINDPAKLNLVAKSKKYRNLILSKMEKDYKAGEQILIDFFSRELSSQERWEYIENYFLGRKVD